MLSNGLAVGKVVQIGLVLYDRVNRLMEKSSDAGEPKERRAEILDEYFKSLSDTDLIMFDQALEYLQESLPWVRNMAGWSIVNRPMCGLPQVTKEQMPAEYLRFRARLQEEDDNKVLDTYRRGFNDGRNGTWNPEEPT